ATRFVIPAGVRLTPDVGRGSATVPTHATPCEPSVELQKVESQSPEPSTAPATMQTPKSRRLEPLSADRWGVHFTADGEFGELLERVRGLAGHRLPSGDLMTLLKRGLEAYERELEKERFAVGRKPRGVAPVPSALADAVPLAPSNADPAPAALPK